MATLVAKLATAEMLFANMSMAEQFANNAGAVLFWLR